MDHQKIKELISSYADGVLTDEDKKAVKEHIDLCKDCRREFDEMMRFEEVLEKMEFKQPSGDVWHVYWESVYNRLERRIGWIFLSIGSIILLFFGAYKLFESIIVDSSIQLLLKIGILTFMGGMIVLLVSVLRERLFVRRRDRYKEVEK